MPAQSEDDVMDGKTEFLDCPAYLDPERAARCGLPAEVTARYILPSTDGQMECARIRCPSGHWFSGPIESLTPPAAAAAGTDQRSRRYP